MIVFLAAEIAGEADGGRDFDLIVGLVLPVAALALTFPELGHGEGIALGQFVDIIQNAVLVAEFRRLEFAAHLVAEAEGDAGIDHRLALEHVQIVFHGDIDVGKDLQIGLPMKQRAGFFAVGRLLFHVADDLAPLKVEGVFEIVAVDAGIKILRRILGGAGAQTVEAQGELVVVTGVVVVFAAGVHLAEHQFPVVALLFFVPVHRAAAPEILHLDAPVLIAGDDDQIAVPLAGFVDGVGEDLKDSVLAADKIIGAENNGGAFAHAVGTLQGGDALISVNLLLGHRLPHILYALSHNIPLYIVYLQKAKKSNHFRLPASGGGVCVIYHRPAANFFTVRRIGACNLSDFGLKW